MYFNGSLKLGGGGAGVFFISPIGENNLNMYSKYFLRSRTTKLSTRHYCTGYARQSLWVSSDYLFTATPCW
jgi:hypothetical protein